MVSSQFIASCALCILAAGIRAASDPEADAVSANAGRDMSFVMVYHKDCDHSLHMAVSDDSYNWRAVNGDRAVVSGRDIAEQKGIRDPFIVHAPDGTFLVAATDLHIFAKREGLRATDWERDGRAYGWGNNRGLVLLKSRDLINWERHNLDFSKLASPTFAKDKDGSDFAWADVGCVWAPEMVWDDAANAMLIHFTVRFGTTPTRIYAAHLTDDLTALVDAPRPLLVPPTGRDFQPMFGILDSDIVKDDEGVWHLFFCSHEYTATIRHATSKGLFGPYRMDYGFSDGEKHGHEAPNCWRRPDGTWVLMWDRYTMKPHNFGFNETKDFREWRALGFFDRGEMKRTGFAEQKHGAVAQAPAEIVHALEEHFKVNN